MSGVGAPAMRPRPTPGGDAPRSPPYVRGWAPGYPAPPCSAGACTAPPTRLEATTPWATPYMSGVGPPAMRPRHDPRARKPPPGPGA
eukprot:gene14860-biopygen12673